MVHWTIAILVTCQLAIAVVLTQLRSLAYGQLVLSLHRQIGLVILLLVVARFVLIRSRQPPTNLSSVLPSWQMRAAATVHGAFYVLLVAQPVIGIFLAWARGDSVGLFGVAQVPAPFEISDALRERLMTVHATTAILLFVLCLVHVGAVVFNRIVRRVSVIDRMLAPIPEDRLVNRIPIAAQLFLAFGLVIGTALLVGINAVATYRDLKNLSFTVSEEGIELSPVYDLLSTAVYHTRAFADHRADWPAVELTIALPDAPTFGAVSRESVLRAGEALGLTRRICERELNRLAYTLPGALEELGAAIATANTQYPEPVRVFLAGEIRLIRTIQHLIVPEMLGRLALP
jgi:cytochrome b561